MFTCCQITCTISWLSCEQLPYPSQQPRISRIWQRDKSKVPQLISTYKYFLPQYSFSTLPFSIPKFIFSAATSTKSSRTPAVKIFFSQNLQASDSSFFSKGNGYQLHRACGLSIPISSFLYCNSLYSCRFIYLVFSSYFLPFLIQNYRIWVTRLLFLLRNPTFNAWVEWAIEIPLI